MVKKIISYTVDVLLVGLIIFLLVVQISMITSRNDPKNYGVPSVFGKSFLYVASESMDDPDNPNSIHKGSGIVIEHVSVDELTPSTPIEKEGEVVDYKKDGSVVTFYYVDMSIVDTHRLVDIIYEESGSITLVTMGDNPEAHAKFTTEKWDSKYLIGKEIYHSDALGGFLAISSADAAAMAGGVAWFFPVAILIPLLILTGLYMYDPIKEYRNERKKRQQLIQEALDNSDVDQSDERAVELFKMKEDMRLDYLEEYEASKAKYKKELEKAKQREEKRIQKEQKKNGKK